MTLARNFQLLRGMAVQQTAFDRYEAQQRLINQVEALRLAAERRSDVIFMDKLLCVDDMRQFYHGIDCYVSPHRSEGLGLTVLEAIMRGCRVVT